MKQRECCLCLKKESVLREHLKKYGGLYCCVSCLSRAVSLAYKAACMFGGTVGEPFESGEKVESQSP